MWTGNSRAEWHDYTSRCIYHVTLKKNPAVGAFGSLGGDWHLPSGVRGSSYLVASALGKAVKQALRSLHSIHPALRLCQYALMPDHLHMIIAVESPLDDILGHKLAAFKVLVNTLTGVDGVFLRGFNDQIIGPNRSLDTVFAYLRDNPRRLAVRRANPDYFRWTERVVIGGGSYNAYGNLHLLENPFMEQVVVHRADSPSKKNFNRQRWLHVAANGGVLVSPFISPAEKEVRKEAERLGGRIIAITPTCFGDRYKPAAGDFALCEQGRLLQISAPAESFAIAASQNISRAHCLALNNLAATLASGE